MEDRVNYWERRWERWQARWHRAESHCKDSCSGWDGAVIGLWADKCCDLTAGLLWTARLTIDCRGQGREDCGLDKGGSRKHGMKEFNDIFFWQWRQHDFLGGLGEIAYLHMDWKDLRREESSWSPVRVRGEIQGPVESSFREEPSGSWVCLSWTMGQWFQSQDSFLLCFMSSPRSRKQGYQLWNVNMAPLQLCWTFTGGQPLGL